jgi:hypothetical protein
MKIRRVGDEFHADGRTDEGTDVTKLIVAFRNFSNASKNVYVLPRGKNGYVSVTHSAE